MKIIRVFFLLLCFFVEIAYAQTVVFGTNNYIEYQQGTLPIILSVPHGGSLEPSSIPLRTCNNPTTVTDAFTIETALEIKKILFETTGCYPHIIICHLKRTKLDCNRTIENGACSNAEAETAWNEFHNYITMARIEANKQYNLNTFFIDLHGHGNPIQRIELGYLLYDDELELSDLTLNTEKYINLSSVKNLAQNNKNNYTHSELLRGAKSLGSLLNKYNYPAVPSQTIPSPGLNTDYFSGGYITANQTGYKAGIQISGVQMELNYTGLRDNQTNRSKFAVAFANAIIEYVNTHFTMAWNSCKPLSVAQNLSNWNINVYPNPAIQNENLQLSLGTTADIEYSIYNAYGIQVRKGTIHQSEYTLSTTGLAVGMYLIYFYKSDSRQSIIKKLIIE
ncbi:MAG TPA: hypothetical protein DCQ31_18045 [Bacteroidales bacterium]|nr:hypothetical protein [Bacteroidales bacterium]